MDAGSALGLTGIALLGAIALVVTRSLTLETAFAAIDVSTILLLYALMIISAQLRLGGFYTRAVIALTAMLERPALFLALSMLVSAVLSAVLANDIVCLAFTPVLTVSLLRARLNPLPFLLGLAMSSNIGSAATIIGNPQNMLIGQVGQLNFVDFLIWCGPPSLAGSYLILWWVFRRHFNDPGDIDLPAALDASWPEFNRWQSTKGLMAVLVLMGLFLTDIPRELSAVGVAGVLLCGRRMQSRHILKLIDWHLITLSCALFIVIEAVETTGLPASIVGHLGAYRVDLTHLPTLTVISTVMSNLFSNVPAAMLLRAYAAPLYVFVR